MQLTIIGTGFVGVVSSAVYASLGHQVFGLDIMEEKITSLNQGKVPFFEPGLEDLLKQELANGNLHFTTDYHQAIADSELIVIAVGTPSAANGQADLRFVESTITSLAPHVKAGAIIAVKSTVPPGTIDHLKQLFSQHSSTLVHWASLPEFLREGSAVQDTLHPDRVVIGSENPEVAEKLAQLHQPFNAPIIHVKPNSAQMGKYAANAYLANRITFINEIANLCDSLGANVQEVVSIIGHDKRIGAHYWYPGFGYGGSCFPKDVAELAAYSRSVGLENNLFNKLDQLNHDRIPQLLTTIGQKVGGWSGRHVAVLGLSFKPHTDDMRVAPSIATIEYLLQAGAHVTGYDPMAIPVAHHFIKEHEHLKYTPSIEEATQGAEVIFALIEWPEILGFDFAKAHNTTEEQWFIDARNQFTAENLEKIGYNYIGIGQGDLA